MDAQAMQVSWTVTEAEQTAYMRAATASLLRSAARPLLVGLAAAVFVTFARGGLDPASGSIGLIVVLGISGYVVLATRSQVKRVVGSAYPVGSTATAQIGPTGFSISTASGGSDFPWGRLTDPKVVGAAVSVKDSLSRRRLTIPRRLMPDDWIARLA